MAFLLFHRVPREGLAGASETIRFENTEGLRCLNEWRAAIDSSTLVISCKITALDLAAWQGRKDMVKLLIAKGAEVGWSHRKKGIDAKETSSAFRALRLGSGLGHL